jgi:DNA-directed RNA polymerase specialized sigma24 family protein
MNESLTVDTHTQNQAVYEHIEQLRQAAIGGDETAIAGLVSVLQTPIRKAVHPYSSTIDADYVRQDATAHVVDIMLDPTPESKYKPQNPLGFAHVVASRMAINEVRKVLRSPQTGLSLDTPNESFDAPIQIAADTDVEAEVTALQLEKELHDVMVGLDIAPDWIALFEDYIHNDHSYETLAATHGLNLRTVGTRIHRIRKALKREEARVRAILSS